MVQSRITAAPAGSLALARLRVRSASLRRRWRLALGKGGAPAEELDQFGRELALVSGVPQLTPELFDDMVRDGETPLLLDVRTPAEYGVSHISGARLVDGRAAMPTAIAAIQSGRPIVVYCAVGVRSTALALRIEAALPRRHWADVYNLEGGIFRWHREGRLLVNAAGPTHRVHAFNWLWGRMLTRK